MITDYRELGLQSLDIVLCSGNSRMSKAIKTMQKLTGARGEAAEISHVGGIFDAGNTAVQYMQESTALNDYIDKSGIHIKQAGVQRNFFNDWLDYYDGKVWVRKLDFKREMAFVRTDIDFWLDHKDDPYESGIMGSLELLLCVARLDKVIRKFWKGYNPLQTKDLHCSEHQAERMKADGIIFDAVSTNKLPPYLWWDWLDMYIKVPVGKAVRIK